MRIGTAGLIGLLLTAPALAGPVDPANPFNAKLLQLRPADQQGALSRAIVDDGNHCGRVVASGYRGAYGNLGRWVVRCTPGGDFSVFTGPDGSVQVRPCADLPKLKLPLCGKIG